MPNTTNFNWVTPADTDLVKDGAAAIRTLGNNIDASLVDLKGGTTGQILSKASNTDLDFTWTSDATGIQATIFDAKGDLIAASAADTAARLASSGVNGDVLTVDTSTSTGLKWAAPSSGENWSLVNAGGTNLTGAQTITVSGISNANSLMIIIENGSSASASSTMTMRFNSDSGSNYSAYYPFIIKLSATTVEMNTNAQTNGTSIPFARIGNSASEIFTGGLTMTGCNSSGLKAFQWVGSGSGTNGETYWGQGFYSGTSTISSVSIISGTGNFDGGKIYVYKSA